ncbi:amidohydrolase family protein [Streptomyces sp. CA-251387]
MSGCIREGAYADLTAFAADPLTSPPETLPHIPITLTVVDGRIVHRRSV